MYEKSHFKKPTWCVWPRKSLKTIGIAAIWYVIYHFPLVGCMERLYLARFPRYYHFYSARDCLWLIGNPTCRSNGTITNDLEWPWPWVTFAVWSLSSSHPRKYSTYWLRYVYTWDWKRTWPVILTVLFKLKNFSISQAVAYTVHMTISRKQCNTLLLHTDDIWNDIWPIEKSVWDWCKIFASFTSTQACVVVHYFLGAENS